MPHGKLIFHAWETYISYMENLYFIHGKLIFHTRETYISHKTFTKHSAETVDGDWLIFVVGQYVWSILIIYVLIIYIR